METNIQATKQIILIKKVMQLENCSFSTAIDIIDRLKNADLLDVYFEMHKEEFKQLEHLSKERFDAE